MSGETRELITQAKAESKDAGDFGISYVSALYFCIPLVVKSRVYSTPQEPTYVRSAAVLRKYLSGYNRHFSTHSPRRQLRSCQADIPLEHSLYNSTGCLQGHIQCQCSCTSWQRCDIHTSWHFPRHILTVEMVPTIRQSLEVYCASVFCLSLARQDQCIDLAQQNFILIRARGRSEYLLRQQSTPE
jgi:hypothetical protein